MKIAFLNTAEDVDWGGGEWWTIWTAEGLRRRGHQVSVYGRYGSRMVALAVARNLLNGEIPVGIDYAPASILRMTRLLRRDKPDVLVVHHNKDVRTGGVAARSLGIAVVHRNGFPVLHNNRRHRFSYKFTDRILTNSQRIRKRYLAFGWIDESTIDVVANGVDFGRLFPAERSVWREWLEFGDDALLAVFAGRLTGVKRAEVLFDVWESLPEDSRWKLIVIGKGHLEGRLKKRLAEPKLKGRVVLTGFRRDASNLLGAAGLVVLPSSEEGMPNVLMEAMALGKAVAASPVGDIPLLLDDGKAGWLVDVDDITAWRDLLTELEKQPEKLVEMGKLGKQRVLANFTFDAMIDGVEQCLAKAIESGKTRTPEDIERINTEGS